MSDTLPKGWSREFLGQITKLIKDGTHGTHKDVADGIPLLSAKDVYDGRINIPDDCRRISIGDYKAIHSAYELQANDILLTIVGTIGRVARLNGDETTFTVQRSVGIIRFLFPEYANFFYHLFQSEGYYRQLINSMNASAQGGVYLGALAKTEVVFPSDNEQKKTIALILDTIDNLIFQTEAVIEKLNNIKTGLMQDLLTKGIDQNGEIRDPEKHPEQFKDSPFGKIPKYWDVVPLGDMGEVIMGQSPPGSSYNQDGKGVPLINGPVEYGPRYPRKIQWTSAPTRLCKPGDILFCVRGSTTGRINISNDTFCIGRGVAAIRGKERVSKTSFIEFFLIRLAKQILSEARGSGSTFPSITSGHLLSTPILKPEVTEQERIVTVLEAADRQAAIEALQAMKLRLLKQGLMQDLLTGEVSVAGVAEKAVKPAKTA